MGTPGWWSLPSPYGPGTSNRAPYPPPTPGASSQTLGVAQSHLGGEQRRLGVPTPEPSLDTQRDPENTQTEGSGETPGFCTHGQSCRKGLPVRKILLLLLGVGLEGRCSPAEPPASWKAQVFPLLFTLPGCPRPGLHSPSSLKMGILVMMQHPGEPTCVLLARCLECNTTCESENLPRQPAMD